MQQENTINEPLPKQQNEIIVKQFYLYGPNSINL